MMSSEFPSNPKNQPEETPEGSTGIPRWLIVFFWVFFFLGAAVFIGSVGGSQSQRAWQAYLINFVFFTGLSFGAVLFVAVLNMTNAVWGRPLKRLAESLGAFVPVSFVLFWVLYFGKDWIFPWIAHPVHGKEVWLNASFLFARNGLGLFVLSGTALALLHQSLRRGENITGQMNPAAFPEGPNPSWRRQVLLSPIFGILYAVVLSLFAFDLIMSLDPHWFSTLFGAYYFIGSFYSALAAILFLAALGRKSLGLEKFILPRHFHDLGKLLLGFCLITGDFFYSQFLVIWYGNLPEETRYVILRVRETNWEPVAWTVLILSFAIPFVVLLSQKIKMIPAAMLALAALILGGMWLERFLLVVPSLWKENFFPFGVVEIAITAGFLGVFALCVIFFLQKFPLLPFSDPLFRKAIEGGDYE
jgi:Ni/Fe-hydrogenase subunit HybB-like protein